MFPLLVTFVGFFVASKRQPFVIEINSFSLSATGGICPFSLSAEAQRALLNPYRTPFLLPLSTTTPSDECWFLIISPVVICHVDRPAARCMCAVGDLNGNGGSAGPRGGGEYEAHSKRRFLQPAGTLFASERLFLFVVGLGCCNHACFRLSVTW